MTFAFALAFALAPRLAGVFPLHVSHIVALFICGRMQLLPLACRRPRVSCACAASQEEHRDLGAAIRVAVPLVLCQELSQPCLADSVGRVRPRAPDLDSCPCRRCPIVALRATASRDLAIPPLAGPPHCAANDHGSSAARSKYLHINMIWMQLGTNRPLHRDKIDCH